MDAVTHIPVLLSESTYLLNVVEGKWYIDATFGRGGHTRAIIEKGGNVIAFDCDMQAIMYGQRKFVYEIEKGRLILHHENFDRLAETVQTKHQDKLSKLAGVLADFGVSSPQLDDSTRGFSFMGDGPLDMRMDDRLGVPASQVIQVLGKKELVSILRDFAQEDHANTIADAIITARSKKPITRTTELAELIERVIPRTGKLHPATKTFLALRMLVNDELGSIERFLPQAFDLLAKNGRFVTISFHEGEDRQCKVFMKEQVRIGCAKEITNKPVMPLPTEVHNNVRSRSAKLRAIEKKDAHE